MQETFSIDQNTYRLSVRASDGLHVKDENNNILIFAAPSFSFDVYESAG